MATQKKGFCPRAGFAYKPYTKLVVRGGFSVCFQTSALQASEYVNLHPRAGGNVMAWLSFVVALLAGAANPFQSGANAQLNKQLGQPLWATAAVYVTGLAGVLLALLFVRQRLPDMGPIYGVSWWAWLGGLISIASTMAGLLLAQRLGSGLFTGLSLTASLLTSVLLDHLGWVGFKQHTASPARLVGCGLMVAGLWMVSRF